MKYIFNRPPQHLLYLLLIPFFWAVLVGASLFWNKGILERHVEQLARDRGHFVFQMVESIRLWNARHGGVYVPVTDKMQPNPYLDIPERDLQTPYGPILTLVNPAFMTRQLSDVVAETHDLLIHITSLKPLNPNNTADGWEAEALIGFERGVDERFEFVDNDAGPVSRYMAPLVTKKACLECHRKQGYKLGDIRGGISVTFPAQPFMAKISSQQANLILIHLVAWLLLTVISGLLLKHQQDHLDALEQEKDRQEQLVQERTRELAKEMQERAQAEENLRLLLESSGEGIYSVNSEGKCLFCNPAAVRLLGYQGAAELMDRNIHEKIHCRGSDGSSAPERECQLHNALREGRTVHSENDYFTRADGSLFPVEYWAHPIMNGGEPIGSVVNFSDITTRKKRHERILHQATHDELTGLSNRNLFQEQLQLALADALKMGHRVGLMYIDLDRFKEVNDTLGHECGDQLLQQASLRIKGCIRQNDTLSRLGGDEFAIVFPAVSLEEGVPRVASQILDEIAKPYEIDGHVVGISASIGVVASEVGDMSIPDLLRRADQTMYLAKEQGRNRFLIG